MKNKFWSILLGLLIVANVGIWLEGEVHTCEIPIEHRIALVPPEHAEATE